MTVKVNKSTQHILIFAKQKNSMFKQQNFTI